MAVVKFYNAKVTIGGAGGPPYTGGTQLPHVHSVAFNYSANMLDISEMGNTTKINLAGLLEWSFDIELLQDFAVGNVDDLLQARIGAAAFGIQVQPDAGTVTTSNPEYYGLTVLETCDPMNGTVGDAIMISATFQCAGNITRRTA